MTFGLHPTVWYNEAGGVTLGVATRTDYLGRFEQGVTEFSVGTGLGSDLDATRIRISSYGCGIRSRSAPPTPRSGWTCSTWRAGSAPGWASS